MNMENNDEQINTSVEGSQVIVEKNLPLQINILDNRTDDVEDKMNKFALFCIHCPSKILNRKIGLFLEEPRELPQMTQKKNAVEIETDAITKWFMVDDMFKFENIGFSHAVGNIKYLSCSDCEFGPVGWYNSDTKQCFVALPRVRRE